MIHDHKGDDGNQHGTGQGVWPQGDMACCTATSRSRPGSLAQVLSATRTKPFRRLTGRWLIERVLAAGTG